MTAAPRAARADGSAAQSPTRSLPAASSESTPFVQPSPALPRMREHTRAARYPAHSPPKVHIFETEGSRALVLAAFNSRPTWRQVQKARDIPKTQARRATPAGSPRERRGEPQGLRV